MLGKRKSSNVVHMNTMFYDIPGTMQDNDDVPTPPLPPTKTHCKVSWSMMFLSEGSGRSESSKSAMV